MRAQIVTAAGEWDTALEAIPYTHVLQSWAWGEVKSHHGWTPTRLLFCENARPVAAAQILRRPLPRSPFGVLYVPKGPALGEENSEVVGSVLSALEMHARAERAIFIKIDPDLTPNHPSAASLHARGWRVSPEQIQFHNTVTLDLTRSEAEILAGMKSKWRYNLRLAEKKGIRIASDPGASASLHQGASDSGGENGGEARWRVFYEMYGETGKRDNFLIRPYEYYRDVWETLTRAHRARVFFALVGDEVAAGLILFRFGKRAWYFYGASRNAHRELMPNHLLQWQAIRWAKGQGCTEYDFWGAPDVLNESAPMYGVYKFKMGFGGEFVERIPAHDFVLNRPLYWLYAVARPRYLARLRMNE